MSLCGKSSKTEKHREINVHDPLYSNQTHQTQNVQCGHTMDNTKICSKQLKGLSEGDVSPKKPPLSGVSKNLGKNIRHMSICQ